MAGSKALASPSGLERAFLEVLDAHLPPLRARSVLRAALRAAGIAAIPDEPIGARLFVGGPLAQAIEEDTDAATAERTIAALEPVLAPDGASGSGVRRQTPKVPARQVVLFSPDASRGPRLAARLRGGARLTQVTDTFQLLAEIDAASSRELTVVVCADAPTLGGPVLDTIERSAPLHTRLVFWGAAVPEGLERPFDTLSASATVGEVAERCAEDPDAEPSRPRVVVCDDDPVWRAVLERSLRRVGYEVIARADGFEALEACIDHRPALVITDFHMPMIDGRQLAALITTRFAPEPPPVLMVTSSPVRRPPGVEAVFDKGGRLDTILAAVKERLPIADEE